jgi:hypothetical protein
VTTSGTTCTGKLSLKANWETSDPVLLDCFNSRKQVTIKVRFNNGGFETLQLQLEP